MSAETPPPPPAVATHQQQQQQVAPPSPDRFMPSPTSPTGRPALLPVAMSPRQASASPKKPPSPSATGKRQLSSTAEGASSTHQQFCLRWNNYQSNLTSVFDQLLQTESFVDVTLACDGQSIKAHKMVLSACSPYFQSLFFDNPCQHPIIIMRDVKWNEMKAIVDFMYKGEINVSQEQIGPMLRIAEMLKIRGLADVNTEVADLETTSGGRSNTSKDVSTTFESVVAPKKPRLSRDWALSSNLDINITPPSNVQQQQQQRSSGARKHRWPSMDISSATDSPIDTTACSSSAGGGRTHTPESRMDVPSPTTSMPTVSTPTLQHHQQQQLMQQAPPTTPVGPPPTYPLGPPMDPMSIASLPMSHADDLEIKPGIAEMIREEERAKLMENSHAWLGASTSSIADSYQYQLQSMWQKCWNTNQNLMHHLRFRERGPLKSWRPETMAEAIFSVLKEGLSLSQAARKYDIPYPTFVLYANRVHNMLGPSIDGGTDLRPKGRGRPQRILLGIWPDEHIKAVIKTVVFRDAKELKDEGMPMQYGRHSPIFPFQDGGLNYAVGPCSNGLPQSQASSLGESMSPEATAAAVAAVAHGLRQQMQMAAAVQHHSDGGPNIFNIPSHLQGHSTGGIPIPKQNSPASSSSQRRTSPSISQGLPNASSLGMGLSNMHIAGLQGNIPTSSVSSRDGSVITSAANSYANLNTSNQDRLPNVLVSSICTPPSSSRNQISPSQQHMESHAHDLRMNSPDESPLNSPMEMLLEPAVNLAVGVSGMTYKPSLEYTSPRAEHLFQDDVSDNNGRNCPSNLNTFKEPSANIKIEPITDCRTE